MKSNEIASNLDRVANEVLDWFQENPRQFTHTPAGKWSAAQHLEHLIRSIKPLGKALSAPKIVLRLSFGKPSDRPVRTYDALKERYDQGIAGGFQAVGNFVPPPIDPQYMNAMLKQYAKYQRSMIQGLGKWSEDQLDQYILPHPALGKLYIREMLYFTIFHTEHHLRILRERYEAS